MTRWATTGTLLLAGLLLIVLDQAAVAQDGSTNEAAHQQFVLGYRLLQRGQGKEAAEAFDRYLGQFPDDAKFDDALYYRALLAMRAGQRRKAIKWLEGSIKPTLVPLHAVQMLRGQLLVDLDEFQAALGALEPILAKQLDPPVRAALLYLRGVAYQRSHNLAAAAEQLEAAARIQGPVQSRAMLDHGRLLAQINQPQQAITVLKQCLTLPDKLVHAEAARIAGDLAYSAGKYDQALDCYRLIVSQFQSSPHFGPAVRGLIWSDFSLHRFAAVLETYARYQAALSKQADRLEAVYLAASAHQELGQHASAAALFASITAEAGRWKMQDKLLYKLALSHLALGQFGQMAEALERLWARCPDSPLQAERLFLLATSELKRGRTAPAAAYLTVIINQGDTHPYYRQALLQRAQLSTGQGRIPHAVRDYQELVRNGQDDSVEAARVQLRLVDLHYQLGQYDQAQQAAAAVLSAHEAAKRDPLLQPAALYRQALALIRLNRYDQALEALDRLLDQHPHSHDRHEARYYRGVVLIALDRAEAALADLTEIGRMQEADRLLRIQALRLAGLHLRQSGRSAAAFELIGELERLAGRDQLTCGELQWLGAYLVERKQFDAALSYLEPLASQPGDLEPPDRAQILHLVGLARLNVGDHRSAANAFEQVIALGAGDELEARLQLGHALAACGRLQKALDVYGGLINQKPTRLAVEALLGQARLCQRLARQQPAQGKTDRARQCLLNGRRALDRIIVLHAERRLSPLPQLAHVELHAVLTALGQLDSTGATDQQLEANLQELIQRDGDGPYATYARAMLARADGRDREALRLVKRLAETVDEPRLQAHLKARIAELESGR